MKIWKHLQMGLFLLGVGSICACTSASPAPPPPGSTNKDETPVRDKTYSEGATATLIGWFATQKLDYSQKGEQEAACADGGGIVWKVTKREGDDEDCPDRLRMEVEFVRCKIDPLEGVDLGGRLKGNIEIAIQAAANCTSEVVRLSGEDVYVEGRDYIKDETFDGNTCDLQAILSFDVEPYDVEGRWCGKPFQMR